MKAFAALILLSLAVSLLALASPIKAQEPINLTIKPDGSIEPSTNLLEKNGSIYTLKDNVIGTIWVQSSNVVIDGGGYTIQGPDSITRTCLLLQGPHDSPQLRNILVTNLKIYNGSIHSGGACNHRFIGNYFDNSGLIMQFGGNATGNLVKHNTFKKGSIFYDYNYYGTDVIKENNFVDSSIMIGLAVSPMADYNYWSDYTAKYPNAKELGNSGTWDTPYVGKTFDMKQCTDYHPLINPITDFEVPGFTNPNLTPIPTQTPTPTSSATLTPTSSPPNFGPTSAPTASPSQLPTINTGAYQPRAESFLSALAVAAIVIVAVVGAGLLVYFKKHKRKKS
jgi:hypothetical protein